MTGTFQSRIIDAAGGPTLWLGLGIDAFFIKKKPVYAGTFLLTCYSKSF